VLAADESILEMPLLYGRFVPVVVAAIRKSNHTAMAAALVRLQHQRLRTDMGMRTVGKVTDVCCRVKHEMAIMIRIRRHV
jgi:hypothetical protein